MTTRPPLDPQAIAVSLVTAAIAASDDRDVTELAVPVLEPFMGLYADDVIKGFTGVIRTLVGLVGQAVLDLPGGEEWFREMALKIAAGEQSE